MSKLNKYASWFVPKLMIIAVLDRLFPKPVLLPGLHTFGQYLCRVAEINCFSNESLVLSLTYLHRIYDFHQKQKKETDKQKEEAQWWQLHRIAVAGLCIAGKFLEDFSVSNQAFADSIGIELKLFNSWEREFFQYMNFDAYADPVDYLRFLHVLQSLYFREINIRIASEWLQKLSKPDRVSISYHWLLFDLQRNSFGPVFIHVSKAEIEKKQSDPVSNCLFYVEPLF